MHKATETLLDFVNAKTVNWYFCFVDYQYGVVRIKTVPSVCIFDPVLHKCMNFSKWAVWMMFNMENSEWKRTVYVNISPSILFCWLSIYFFLSFFPIIFENMMRSLRQCSMFISKTMTANAIAQRHRMDYWLCICINRGEKSKHWENMIIELKIDWCASNSHSNHRFWLRL